MYEKIRQNWLISFFVYYVGLYTIYILDQLFGKFIDGFTREVFISSDEVIFFFLIVPAYKFITAYITFHFAYAKRGTTWLFIYMPILFLTASIKLIDFISYGLHDWGLKGVPVGVMFVQIIAAYISTYYLLNCYKLYRLNCEKDVK